VLELPAVDGDRAKRERKGSIAELRSVPRTVTPITPVEIVRSDGRRELYDSLVFANVTRIAKYGRLRSSAAPTVGCSRWCRVDTATGGESPPWRCAPRPVGSEPKAHVSGVEFATINAIPCQIDGEVLHRAPEGAHHRLCPARRRHGRANPDVADPDPNQDRTHPPLLGPFGIELSGHGGGRFCRVSGACLN
jgi:hypothetical protein